MNDHVHPLFSGILNAVSGRTTIKLSKEAARNHQPVTPVAMSNAINKALDLIDSLMQEVHDPLDRERYDKKYNEVLDELFPERTSATPSNNE